jgi:hypothetical protein
MALTFQKFSQALSWRDGALYATLQGKTPVRILEGFSSQIYVDDIDDVHVFLGMQVSLFLVPNKTKLSKSMSTTCTCFWASRARRMSFACGAP